MDIYIYAAGTFDAAQLAQVDTIAPDVQAAARYRFPYARVPLGNNIYAAFAKWDGWQKLMTPGVIVAMLGHTTPGLYKAECKYQRENPAPIVEPSAVQHDRATRIRGYCELACIAVGMSESEVVRLPLERLAGIASLAQVRIVTLADFMDSLQDEVQTFTPGDLNDFDKVMSELNPGQ